MGCGYRTVSPLAHFFGWDFSFLHLQQSEGSSVDTIAFQDITFIERTPIDCRKADAGGLVYVRLIFFLECAHSTHVVAAQWVGI